MNDSPETLFKLFPFFLPLWLGSRREGKPQAPQRKKVGKQSQYFSIILNIHLWGSCSPQMSQFLDFYGDVYVCVYYTLFSNGNIDLGNNCWTVKNHLHKLLPPLLLVSERGETFPTAPCNDLSLHCGLALLRRGRGCIMKHYRYN